MHSILDNFIIVALVILSFIGGMKISDHYHAKALLHERIELQRQYVRLQTGQDADDPCQPYIMPQLQRQFTVTPEFLDRLRTNGAATMAVPKKQKR